MHVFNPYRQLSRNLWLHYFLSGDKKNSIKGTLTDLNIKQDMLGDYGIRRWFFTSLAFLLCSFLRKYAQHSWKLHPSMERHKFQALAGCSFTVSLADW